MYEWGIGVIYTSFFASLPLFFVKRERARKILLYSSLLLVTAGLASSITGLFMASLSGFQASLFLSDLMWHAASLKFIFIPALIAFLFIPSANAVAKRRTVKHLPPSDPINQSGFKALTRLQKSKPMFGMFQIIAIVFASLLATAMLVFAREVVIERYKRGLPVDLPEASYAKLVCSTCEVVMISMGPDGEISTHDETMRLEQLEWTLAEKIKDNPRRKDHFINAQGEVYRDEFVTDIGIHLRVDANCPFEKIQPVLRMLERRKIRWAYFRVTEE